MKRLFFLLTCFITLVNARAQDYKKLHFNSILCDTHNDIISTCLEKGYSFDQDLTGKTHSDLNRMFKAGVDVQVFSIWCDGTQTNPYAFANREIDTLYAWIKRNPDKMMLVKNSNELMQAVRQHKLASMIGVEGGHMMENDLHKLDSLYARGTRYMTLTWNNSTSWATSARDETQHSFIVSPYGLTDFGKSIVRKMNELGMMVDVSHIGEKTFWDVLAIVDKPVIASHSCVYSLCPVFRNLKDDQIRAIAKNGGVIQVNFFSGFVDSTYDKKEKAFVKAHQKEFDSLDAKGWSDYYVQQLMSKKYPDEAKSLRPPMSMLIDHIDYIVKLVGADYVGLGSDFDGCESTPVGLDGVQDYHKIVDALVQRKYSQQDIKKIMGENFLRVFKANVVNYAGRTKGAISTAKAF